MKITNLHNPDESNWTTNQIRLYLFNDYDLYHLIVKRLKRQRQNYDEQIITIRMYAKIAFDHMSKGSCLGIEDKINHKYLLKCFDEDLAN